MNNSKKVKIREIQSTEQDIENLDEISIEYIKNVNNLDNNSDDNSDNLENSNKQKVIGYLYERGLTGYQIIKK